MSPKTLTGEELEPILEGVRINLALVETDLVVAVTAAETVVNGGTGVLIGSCDAATIRGTIGATSLLLASTSLAWKTALAIEQAIAERTPIVGVSLVLDLPRLAGTFRGYPSDPETVREVERSWTRAVFSRLPGALRVEMLERQGRRLDVTAAYAGPPSVAHAEALVRGVELRGARLEEPVDGLVVGVPWVGPHAPRTPVNPITAAVVALGLAARMHRNQFPVREDGSLVLVHSLRRSFAPPDAPYAWALEALRKRDPGELEAAERSAATDGAMLAAYRRGDTCHPLLPFADWAACAPPLDRLGRVVVAGCRDAHAARALGFVPSHGIGSALAMAHGVAGGKARIGILLAPPYAPLIVG